MKTLLSICLVVASCLATSGTADACWLWPCGGYWGAGYYGAPVSYGYYRAPVYTAGYYSAGLYSASYPSYGYSAVSTSSCCAPICCDPCAGGCGVSGCASGACGAACVGTEPAGTLKPAADPNFENGTRQYERDTTEPAPADVPERTFRGREPAPDDSFDALPAQTPNRGTDPAGTGGSGTGGAGEMFDETPALGTDQQTNKPPMSDPLNDQDSETATDPAVPDATKDDKTFLDPNAGSATPATEDDSLGVPQARRFAPASFASRSSRLDEVLKPRRLASRSLPAAGQNAGDRQFAGRAAGDRNAVTPVRWIEAPAADGRVRL